MMPTSKFLAKPISYLSALAASAVISLLSGCASGGYKLTREYASWMNRQNIILRVLLYLLTSFVFVITMLIDVVINNTIDFWEGKVSAGEYKFHQGDKTYVVKHEYQPNSQRRISTIHVLAANEKVVQEVILRETVAGEIEMLVDGRLRTRVSGLSELPMAAIFDGNGKLLRNELIVTPTLLANGR